MKTLVRSTTGLIAAVSLTMTATAFAASLDSSSSVNPVASKIVRFADLDMSKPAGAETLYSRIKAAARTVCRGTAEPFMSECRAEAVEDAVVGVGNPLLTETHRAATREASRGS